MGFMPSPSGIDVFFYDKSGKRLRNMRATHSLFTHRSGVGDETTSSRDWLKQIFVADSEEGLAALLRRETLDSDDPPGTSGASRNVTVCQAEGLARLIQDKQTVIALGDEVPDTNPKGPFFLTKELHISPVSIGQHHPLRPLWDRQIKKI